MTELDKPTLRRRIRQARREHTTSDIPVDAALCRAALPILTQQPLPALLAFWPMPGEIDLRPLLAALAELGIPLWFPRCLPGHRLAFAPAHPAGLIPGAYGIPEPPVDSPFAEPPAGALCLVPALAYDRSGYRLGQGGGYYDRYLAAHPQLPTLGLCRERELFDALPHAPWDRPVALLCTEQRTLTPASPHPAT